MPNSIAGFSHSAGRWVTHEMGFAREVSNRVIFIDEGRIQEDEPPQELFTNPKHPRLKAFLSKML